MVPSVYLCIGDAKVDQIIMGPGEILLWAKIAVEEIGNASKAKQSKVKQSKR